MKKVIAFALIGAMLMGMNVCAAGSPSAAVVASQAEKTTSTAAPEQDAAAAVAAQVAAQAAEVGKTAGEYTNNAIVEVPGLTDVVPTGQGGHVIINGAPSNVIFFLDKPSQTAVTSAKNQAAALGGKVLNVFKTKAVVGKFDTAKVNFYMKGVKAGQLIKVYQQVNGEWVEVEVAEIREDHVVINMTSHGILAFIEVPAAPAQ